MLKWPQRCQRGCLSGVGSSGYHARVQTRETSILFRLETTMFLFSDEVCVDSLLTPCVVVIVCCIHFQPDLSYRLIPLNV